jgi:hypothetical protein
MPEPPPDFSTEDAGLDSELVALRRRGWDNLNLKSSKQGKIQLRRIATMAYEYAGIPFVFEPDAKLDREVIRTFLRDAVQEIEEVASQTLISRLYGFHRDVREITMPGELRGKAIDLGGLNEDRFKELYPKARVLLAKAMHTVLERRRRERKVHRPTGSIAVRMQNLIPYERRESYHRRFQQLLNDGYRRIILTGGRGNGKSRLALELVASQEGALHDGIYVKATSAPMAAKELLAIVSARGAAPGVGLQEAIAEMLCGPDAPSYVVIDNVEDPALLDTLLPSDTRSVIVVTTSQTVPGHHDSTLEVVPMERPEAERLAEKLLPNVGATERTAIVVALGYKPLAIVHACGLIIGSGFVTPEEFISSLKQDAASTLNVPAVVGELTLTTIYKQTLSQLARMDADTGTVACRVLELVACVAPDGIPTDLLREALQSSGERPTTSTQFAEALLALQTRFLVTKVEGRLAVHPLTQELLRSILRAKEQELCLRLHQPVRDKLQKETPGLPLSGEALDLLPHVTKIAAGLAQLDADSAKEIGLDHTLAVVVSGCRQIGFDRGDFVMGIKPLQKKFVESRNCLNADDTREAFREFTLLQHSTGQISTDLHSREMLGLLGIFTDVWDLSQYKRLSTWDVLDAATTAFACGQCQLALAVLRSQDDRIRNTADSPAQYGYFKTLLGEILLMQGDWQEAEGALKEALSLYRAEDSSPRTTRGTMRTLKALACHAAMSRGNGDEILQMALEVLDQRLDDINQDSLTRAYFAEAGARLLVRNYLHSFYRFLATDPEYRESPETLGERAAKVTHAQKKANDAYVAGGYVRESQALYYDRILVEGTVFPTPSHIRGVITGFQPTGHFADSPLVGRQVELAGLKLVALFCGRDADHSIIEGLQRRADNVAYFTESYYWYAEYLAMACVLSVQCNYPAGQMLYRLNEAYEALGRQDRIVHVAKAMMAWPDRREFLRHLAYLLTF